MSLPRLLVPAFTLLAFAVAAAFAPQAALAQAEAARTGAPASFVEACADKSKERGRLRFCDEYFVKALGAGADPVLYLRDRITVIRAQHEASAAEKYQSFLTAIYITAFLAIATMVLIASERKLPRLACWSIITVSAALLVLIGAVAAGWLGKYRAEHSAQVELGLLRDQIEIEASQRIANGEKLTMDDVHKWSDRLYDIGQRFAVSYSDASMLPDFGRFNAKH